MTAVRPGFPAWFAPLATVLADVEAHDVTRFLPPPGHRRRSAVLMLFGESGGVRDILLTERASTLRSHAGQVALPGGRIDAADTDPVAAALREAQEETGVDPSGVVVAGTLPELYLSVSDYAVTPVLAWWARPVPVGVVDTEEVARVVRVPVDELLDPGNRFRVAHPSGYVGPGFAASGLFVWGFTAGLLDRLFHLCGWERPWDRTRVVPLPLPTGSLPIPSSEPRTSASPRLSVSRSSAGRTQEPRR